MAAKTLLIFAAYFKQQKTIYGYKFKGLTVCPTG